MGTSKTHRSGPAWEARNTPRGREKYSKGSKTTAEGTHMSGYDSYGRMGMSKGTRKKSYSHKTTPKTADKHGY